MNIGIVCYPTFGGSGVVATELGKQLALRNHNVHFVSYQQPFRLDAFYPNIFYHEVNIYSYALFEMASPYESVLTSKLVDVVLNEKLDILHVHYAIPHASVAYLVKQILASKGIKIPVVTTLHGTDITLIGKDKSFAPVVEFSVNQSDAVTVVSEFLKKETLLNFDIHKHIDVIYNFIDLAKTTTDIKKPCSKSPLATTENIITHVSNFRKVKRIQDIVLGFEQVIQNVPSKLLLVGDGPERPMVEDLVREKNLQHSVKFLGKQENVNLLYAMSDVFVLASEHESFGLAALEAMSCGVPVVSTNTGGLPELNTNGKTGFTFDLGNTEAMADAIIRILTDQDLKHNLKCGAFEQAKRFDVHHIIPQYLAIYERTLQQ